MKRKTNRQPPKRSKIEAVAIEALEEEVEAAGIRHDT
jgi:hypothetical protein